MAAKAGQGKRKNTSPKKKTAAKDSEIPEALYTEIGILFLLAFCVILILGNFGLTLRFGDVFNSLFFGLFGGMEYLFPFLLFAGVCFYLVNRGKSAAVIKLISCIVLFFDAGMFLQLICTGDYNLGGYSGTYDYSSSNRSGGGLFSGSLFEVLKKNLGEPATVIIMILILLICLLVISGKSLIRMLSYPGSEIVDRARESRIEREKDREAIWEERQRIREERREERSKRRAIEREEKRQRYRENSMKRGRDFMSLTVGDDSNTENESFENSFLQNDIFEEEVRDTKEDTASQGYSPFAVSAEHMIKPKDFDKKTEPKPIPEVRQKEQESRIVISEELPPGYAEEYPEEYHDKYRDEYHDKYQEEYHDKYQEEYQDKYRDDYHEKYPEESPEEYPVVFPEDFPEENSRDNDTEKEESYKNTFYEDLRAFHETEKNDMHEIVFDSDDVHTRKDEASTGPFFNEFLRENNDPHEEEEPYSGEEEEEEPYFAEDDASKMFEEEPDIGDEWTEERETKEEAFDYNETEELIIRETQEEVKKSENKPYELPPLSLLRDGKKSEADSAESLRQTAEKLKNILLSFGVRVKILNYIQGPTVTRFEMQPEQGVKVNTILNLSNDIQMNLAAKDIRIEAPIPGKAAVGIEIPNKTNQSVMLKDLISGEAFKNASSKITIAVGKDIGGETIVYDIDKMPHLLIAGATGSGKSVCINTIIMSLLYKATPDEVRLIMIDPKVVELSVYNGIPHLLTPVVTDPVKAAGALNWGVAEMMKRYDLFASVQVRNMESYNEKVDELNRAGETLPDGSPHVKLPQIVIIVDELADLMMVQKKDVETTICRLTQLARAAGIHLIIATQRPSVDVITGLIKANMPSRVAFAVSSNVDSRTILDMAGAEKLLGNGDMLFYPQKYPKPERLQGAFVSDDEVQAVTDFIRNQAVEKTDKDIAEEIEAASQVSKQSEGEALDPSQDNDDGRDSYFMDAGRFVTEKQKATIGVLQRVFRIGFNRAARIMDQLAEAGVVSGEDGTKPRQVLMTKEEFEEFMKGIQEQ